MSYYLKLLFFPSFFGTICYSAISFISLNDNVLLWSQEQRAMLAGSIVFGFLFVLVGIMSKNDKF